MGGCWGQREFLWVVLSNFNPFVAGSRWASVFLEPAACWLALVLSLCGARLGMKQQKLGEEMRFFFPLTRVLGKNKASLVQG